MVTTAPSGSAIAVTTGDTPATAAVITCHHRALVTDASSPADPPVTIESGKKTSQSMYTLVTNRSRSSRDPVTILVLTGEACRPRRRYLKSESLHTAHPTPGSAPRELTWTCWTCETTFKPGGQPTANTRVVTKYTSFRPAALPVHLLPIILTNRHRKSGDTPMSHPSPIRKALSVAQLTEYRQLGWSYRRIGEETGFTTNQVARYATQVLPRNLRIFETYQQRGRCPRCSLIPWPENPLTDSGLCLWCDLERRGIDLLDWHQSGQAQTHLAHAMALRMDGTQTEYKRQTDKGCTHPQQPSELSTPSTHHTPHTTHHPPHNTPQTSHPTHHPSHTTPHNTQHTSVQ